MFNGTFYLVDCFQALTAVIATMEYKYHYSHKYLETLTLCMLTPDRWQLKMLLPVNKCRSKIIRNSVFDCHLSPVGRQMAIKKSVSNYF